jgi:hypothetical protein
MVQSIYHNTSILHPTRVCVTDQYPWTGQWMVSWWRMTGRPCELIQTSSSPAINTSRIVLMDFQG